MPNTLPGFSHRLNALALIFLFIACSLLFAGCKEQARSIPNSGTPVLKKDELYGTVKNGRYIAPHKNFSCQIPQSQNATALTKDDKGSFGGTVYFSDTSGTFIRITYQVISKQTQKDMKHSNHPLKILQAFLQSHIIRPLMRQIDDPVQIVKDAFWIDKKNPMLFSLLLCPKASPYQEINTERRADAFRGSIVFYQKPYLYGVTLQDKKYIQNAHVPADQMHHDLQGQLQLFLDTFRF